MVAMSCWRWESVMSRCDATERSSEVLGGVAVFRGTRVAVKTLIDYLEVGDRLADFLDDFPTVKREQAEAVLELAKKLIARGQDETATG